MEQISAAVKYLHEFNPPILHRDLKPENILLFEDNIVKLSDFGCSSFLEGEQKTICGTLDYLAPEIIEMKPQSAKTDIWQLGVLFYELLNGCTPFDCQESWKSESIW